MADVWYTYVDWTLEEPSRPFNVGKGTINRVGDVLARNVVWHRIASKHGHRREIVFSSSLEQACFEMEQELIVELKTCPYIEGGWGANLSMGGSGPTGARWATEARAQLSAIVTEMWRDPSYRQKLMVACPVSRDQLYADGQALTWDDIASKYEVSATTVKRWFGQLDLMKGVVKPRRKQWTTVEDERLMLMYDEKKTVRFMARTLERSECSVKKRVQKLCNGLNIERSRYRRCA